ncbi:MAG: PilW family protein [Agathobacter sp.]
MRQDNRGLTLVELMIAIAMSTIILGAAALFLKNAMNSYETATATIDLQMESQIVMEQVGTWIMEGNSTEVVSVTDPITASTTNVLVIYNIPELVEHSKWPIGMPEPTTVGSMRIIWQKENRLYMVFEENVDYLFGTVNATVTPDYSSAAYQTAVDAYPSFPFSEVTKNGFFLNYLNTKSIPLNCVSEYVDTFTVTKTQIRQSSSYGDGTEAENLIYNQKITIDLILREAKQEFKLTNEFKVRNEIYKE